MHADAMMMLMPSWQPNNGHDMLAGLCIRAIAGTARMRRHRERSTTMQRQAAQLLLLTLSMPKWPMVALFFCVLAICDVEMHQRSELEPGCAVSPQGVHVLTHLILDVFDLLHDTHDCKVFKIAPSRPVSVDSRSAEGSRLCAQRRRE